MVEKATVKPPDTRDEDRKNKEPLTIEEDSFHRETSESLLKLLG